jgi:cytochrome c5
MQYLKSKGLWILLLGISGICGFLFSWYVHHKVVSTQQADVQTIQTFHFPAVFVEQLKNDPQAGMKIFKEFCASCHAKIPTIDVSAPRLGDKKAWQSRRQKSEKQLLDLTLRGIGAMPARGGCFECSDEQLRETIRYMLKQ